MFHFGKYIINLHETGECKWMVPQYCEGPSFSEYRMSAKKMKNCTLPGWMILWYIMLRFKLLKYRMGKSSILQYRNPQCLLPWCPGARKQPLFVFFNPLKPWLVVDKHCYSVCQVHWNTFKFVFKIADHKTKATTIPNCTKDSPYFRFIFFAYALYFQNTKIIYNMVWQSSTLTNYLQDKNITFQFSSI